MVKWGLHHTKAPPRLPNCNLAGLPYFSSCSVANRVPVELYRGKGTRFAEQLLAACI